MRKKRIKKASIKLESNGQVCSCGQHFGIGKLSPEERFRLYRRMAAKYPRAMREDQWEYMRSYNAAHPKFPAPTLPSPTWDSQWWHN